MGHLFNATEPVPGPSDRELVASMHDAGSTAFETLFRRHANAVHALISAKAANADHVDDLLQETFVLAWRKLDAAKMPSDSALPWLLLTAQRLVANYNRTVGTSSRSTTRLDNVDRAAGDSTFDAAVGGERAVALESALAKLSTQDRKIVLLCLEEGLQYKEAAQAMRTSTSAVRNILFRARKALRRELSAVVEEGHG